MTDLLDHLADLQEAHRGLDGLSLLRALLREGPLDGRTALVSSFGAESVVLLDMVATIDPMTPVIFLDTGKLFPETQAYREEVTALLGLADVRLAAPQAGRLTRPRSGRQSLAARAGHVLRDPKDRAAGCGARRFFGMDHRA